MTANTPKTFELDVEDVHYHRDKPLLARLFKPRGAGPFPLVVEVHGGAWCHGDRLNDDIINEPLARSGVVVAALDFRMPPEAGRPSFTADMSGPLAQDTGGGVAEQAGSGGLWEFRAVGTKECAGDATARSSLTRAPPAPVEGNGV